MFHSCRFRRDRGAFVAVSGFSSSLRVPQTWLGLSAVSPGHVLSQHPVPHPGRKELPFRADRIGGKGVRFLRSHLLLWKDPDFGRAWCWWLACHLLTRREATHPVKWLLGHKLFTAFSYERHFILFSKRTPTAKIPSFFIYFLYLFVISVVSDCLSICPTHEPCVYIKSWCCCERQRVSIASPTLPKDVFLGRPQLGRCQQGQEPLHSALISCWYCVVSLVYLLEMRLVTHQNVRERNPI